MTAGGVCVWGRVEWGGGLPLKSQKNTVSGSSCQQTCHFFAILFLSIYHFTPDLISVLPPTARQRWAVERDGGEGTRWKSTGPRRQVRNRCWADGTWQRHSAPKR